MSRKGKEPFYGTVPGQPPVYKARLVLGGLYGSPTFIRYKMVFEYKRQPYKALYLTYEALLTVFLRLPYWVVRYSFRGLRPRSAWSFKRALMNAFIRQFNFVSTLCERYA